MRAFVHIVVDELHGHWSASFSGMPHVGYAGKWPADAVRRVVEAAALRCQLSQPVPEGAYSKHKPWAIR